MKEASRPGTYSDSLRYQWVKVVVLIGIFAAGAYFRLVGINWDNNQHLHPDERFMTMVASSISSTKSFSDYFKTEISSLNPYNHGYGFYVYGTLPLFIVRLFAEAINQVGYDEITLVGRALSGLVDLLTVLFVYLITQRLFRKQHISLLAAAFYALSVLPIQLSHYFTVDTFTNFFTLLAFYFAVVIIVEPIQLQREVGSGFSQEEGVNDDTLQSAVNPRDNLLGSWLVNSPRSILPYAWFGLALGMAMASKISAAPLALLLPGAAWLAWKKLPKKEQNHQSSLYILILLRNLVIAAIVTILAFRFFQPYAFTGPGFFDVALNPHWVDNLKELNAQSGGNVDFPPALQWARRPITFAWQNMVLWGLGAPLGLLAWVGFLWMAWKIIRNSDKEGSQYALLWGWTLVYFVWQSFNFSRSMRYQMPVYPTLAIIAAWVIFLPTRSRWRHILKSVIGVGVLLATLAWAFAFTRIYTRPVTRVAASEWIYQNVPAAINLRLDTGNNTFNQPLAFRSALNITKDKPLRMAFVPSQDGILMDVNISHVAGLSGNGANSALRVRIVDQLERQSTTLTTGTLTGDFKAQYDPRGESCRLAFDPPIRVHAGTSYYLVVQPDESETTFILAGSMTIGIQTGEGLVEQVMPDPVSALSAGQDFTSQFQALKNGNLTQIFFPRVVDWESKSETKTVRIEIRNLTGDVSQTFSTTLESDFRSVDDPRGQPYRVKVSPSYPLQANQLYQFRLVFESGPGRIALYGSKPASESTWDDPLPLAMQGYDPFDYFSGLYRSDLNFEMYWDDNAEKRERFLDILNQADYIFISSNRQWGTTVRVPERYPLETLYYRHLLGCPAGKDILWCYRVAEPGMFHGDLGFELVYVNQSDPNIGPLRINTQFAEEAFTVYDHPKVLIFKRTPAFSIAHVRELFASIDLSRVVHLLPGEAANYKNPELKGDLLMPADMLRIQQSNGTWSELFNRNSVQNAFQVIGLLLWYVVITLLGWMVYPFVRMALGGLADRGYPVARIVGILLLAYFSWLAGSFGILVSRLTITLIALVMLLVNIGLAASQWESLRREFQQSKRYYLLVEGLALTFFLLFLFVRLGNPDLWHPYKGGEKPMDFSYLNAVIKSALFPPYDPWFAGGYINYYYYGFVIMGVLIKWMGIIPSVAYNLVIPTLFSLSALGAFSCGWNLLAGKGNSRKSRTPPEGLEPGSTTSPDGREQDIQDPSLADTGEQSASDGVFLAGQKIPQEVTTKQKLGWIAELVSGCSVKVESIYAGLAASVGLVIVGNLGTVRMIWRGLQRLAAPGGDTSTGNVFQLWLWFFEGIGKFFQGNGLPYGPGDWYWIPSRVIPAEPITEFPFFTFLYADLHAHMVALPITLLALVWVISIIRGGWVWGDENGRLGWLRYGASFFLASLAIGVLRPTNTWDMPTYLVLGGLVVLYIAGRYATLSVRLPVGDQRIGSWSIGVASVVLLVILSFLLFRPYAYWYIQPYNQIQLWKEGRYTPFFSYTTQWGLFLFVIVSWFSWETIDWMAKTPLSALRKLYPFRGWIYTGLMLLVALMILLSVIGLVLSPQTFAIAQSPGGSERDSPPGAQIAWLVLPLATWAGILILRPGQPDSKRIVLFMVGTALVLTLSVELIVLQGDIGRMNTVFKFYFQAWTLFAISAGAGLAWLLPAILERWPKNWQTAWQVSLVVLVGGALLFPLLGGIDKITDRMSKNAPHTLDGMEYMAYSHYNDQDKEMDLSQDYRAIWWMQNNVKGSPVIVEGNTPEYRWGSRFTIYTGLPGVVGWNWHQRQQRGVVSDEWVTDRISEIASFYQSVNRDETLAFLQKYGVKYIILGQLERAYYNGPGLNKFDDWNGDLWHEVYRDGETSIYEVLLH